MPSHQGNYLAFTNSEYDKSDVKDSCRGYFCNEEDLLKCVKGDRYDYKYLTILDLDTFGFTEYVWNPMYVDMDRRKMEDGTWVLEFGTINLRNGLNFPLKKVVVDLIRRSIK